ncbi:SDR family oxidoreductase [Novosphingopyxis baekryungensis]|uniref:SDR family oxidoreductase n=1 Tax=Novosphingopyxis baekryungensis TaxID=279369 RepID=UPI0003B79B50|nr:SDR family oxidoreductase [Novosphingopyxis baekryungensis]
MQKLIGKICLVTGAARGIGEAIARAFHREGGHLIITDIDESAGQELAEELGGQFFRLDVSEEADWDDLARNVPQLDILVNNAGITGFEHGPAAHDPEHATLESWRRVHAVNSDGTFLGCRYAIRAMRARGAGSIINISSRSGMVGIPGAAAYAASKAAVRNHSKTVALYCAQQGLAIRCNSIHPAAILTAMWEPMLGDEPGRQARMDALVADTPLRRFGTPQEVAALAVLLASDEASYMTGAELTLDGGILAGSAAAPGS